MLPSRYAIPLLIVMALGLAACGSDGSSDASFDTDRVEQEVKRLTVKNFMGDKPQYAGVTVDVSCGFPDRPDEKFVCGSRFSNGQTEFISGRVIEHGDDRPPTFAFEPYEP
jgi:hypothetical protein